MSDFVRCCSRFCFALVFLLEPILLQVSTLIGKPIYFEGIKGLNSVAGMSECHGKT